MSMLLTERGHLAVLIIISLLFLTVGCDEQLEDINETGTKPNASSMTVNRAKDVQSSSDHENAAQEVSRSRNLSADDPAVIAAYDEYIAAYNKMIELNHAGKGDTDKGRQAYDQYLKARKKYNEIYAKVKPPEQH